MPLRIALILLVVLAVHLPVAVQATVVRMQTSLGVVDIELYDGTAPLTASNFLNYVNRGAYNSTFIHRSVPGFIVQGGGYALIEDRISKVVKDPPVSNEFSSQRSNVRGTVAMAKVDGQPDSATNEWFVNLGDNSANLDAQNGGFTVFGRVMGDGMTVFDAISRLKRVNAGGVFTTLPVTSVPQDGKLREEHLVFVRSVQKLPTGDSVNAADRLFNYLEAAYSQYLAPASQPSASVSGYYYRYYPGTGGYIATRDNTLYYLGPFSNWDILPLGGFDDWLSSAKAAGY